MKLTIKELAPYLPYKLRVFDQWSEESQGEFLEVCGFDGDMQEWLLYDNIDGSTINYCKSLVKMVLRPLSDLDNYLRNEFEKLDRGYAYDKIAVDLFCEENGVSELIENTEINSLPYECVEYMFEHHYDVFNLHENGLCIYYNEL